MMFACDISRPIFLSHFFHAVLDEQAKKKKRERKLSVLRTVDEDGPE